MAVQKDRPAWTDDRLDDLSQTMREGLAGLDANDRELSRRIDAQTELLMARIDAQSSGIDKRFTGMDERFTGMEQRFTGIDERFDALQRTMILGMIGVLGTIVAGFAASILTLA